MITFGKVLFGKEGDEDGTSFDDEEEADTGLSFGKKGGGDGPSFDDEEEADAGPPFKVMLVPGKEGGRDGVGGEGCVFITT
jgi:hypothetical protein